MEPSEKDKEFIEMLKEQASPIATKMDSKYQDIWKHSIKCKNNKITTNSV